MKAVFLGSGHYIYNEIEYIAGIPVDVPKENEQYIEGIGKFQIFQDDFKIPDGFVIRNTKVYTKLPKKELDEDFIGRDILVKRNGGLGDVVGALSCCELIKAKDRTCNITFACHDWQIPFVKMFRCVDEVVDYPETRKLEKFIKFKYILDFIYTVEGNEKRRTTDYYDLYKDRLGPLFKDDKVILPNIDLKYDKEINDWLNSRGLVKEGFIIIHPGGSADMRKWGNERWRRLAYEIAHYTKYDVVVTGSEYDFHIEDIKARIYSALGLPIEHVPNLIDACKLIVTTDTGLLHFAGLVNKHSISLWGNTNPKSVVSYYKRTKTIMGKCDIGPCFALKKSMCPYLAVTPMCMDVIRVEDVINLLKDSGIEFKYKVKTGILTHSKYLSPKIYSSVYGDIECELADISLVKNKTSILFITQSEVKAYSGGRYYGWMMMKSLASMGYDVWVLTNSLPPFYKDFDNPDYKGSFHTIVDPEMNGTKFECKFDYVIGEPYNTGKNAVEAGKKLNSKIYNIIYETPNYIREYREGDDTNDDFWITHKRAMLESDSIICLSKLGRQKVKEWDDDFKNKQVIPIYPTVNEHAAKPYRFNKTRVYSFIFIGMNKNYKNAHLFVDACIAVAEILNIEIRVVLVGHSVSKAVRNISATKVRFDAFDNCSEADKFRLISESQCVVFPTSFEGFGIPILEAMYMQKSLVLSDLPIFREILEACPDYPYWFKSNDYDDLVRKMVTAKQNLMHKEGRSKKQSLLNKKLFPALLAYNKRLNPHIFNKYLRATFPKINKRKQVLISDMVIGTVSTFNEKCGIAENTYFYQKHITSTNYVFAPTGGNLLPDDGANVIRCWNRRFDNYDRLLREILNAGCNIIHIHHEFSFFSGKNGHLNLYNFIKQLKENDIKVLITFHTYRLNNGIISTLQMLCDWSTVCNVDAFKLVKNQSRFCRMSPVGLPIRVVKGMNRFRAREKHTNLNYTKDDVVIGLHGFWNVHKRYDLVVQAVYNLHKEYKNVKLLIIGSYEYKNQYALHVRGLIQRYGIEDLVTIINSYLPIDQVCGYLQVCDVLVYPYSVDGYYSSSAAARTGIASKVPIMTSDSLMFSDLKIFCKRFIMDDVDDLTKKLKSFCWVAEDVRYDYLVKQSVYHRHYSSKKTYDRYKSIYKKLLSEA